MNLKRMELGMDNTRLVGNVLMVLLVALNIFFSIQYIGGINTESELIAKQAEATEKRIEVARFLKLFVEEVLGTNGVVAFEARVQLENDVRQLGDKQIIDQWESLVNATDGEEAQKRALLLLSLLSNKMIQ